MIGHMEVIRWHLLVNLAAYVLLAVTGAVLVNGAIDAGYDISAADESADFSAVWTAASGFANLVAMLAGVVGAAATLPGLHHVRAWNQASLPAAAYSGFMAWLLTLLALGLGIKEAIMGASVHEYKLGLTRIFLGGKPGLLFAVSRDLLLGLLSAAQPCYLRAIFYTGAHDRRSRQKL